MKKVMLIGYGAMAQAVIERLPPQVRVEWIVARESHHAAICLQFGQAVTPLTDPLQCGGTPGTASARKPLVITPIPQATPSST